METEIIFSGLCSFLNVHDENKDIVEPSVILVQTDYCGAADCNTQDADDGYGNGNGVGGHMVRAAMPSNEQINQEADNAGVGNGNGDVHRGHIHIPYIAYDTEEVRVDNGCGFLPVPGAPTFRFMSLDGVELIFPKHTAAKPAIDPSYDERVAQKDKYWPAAAKLYNECYVPKRDGKPNKNFVKAFLRFHGGELSAGKLARCVWAFLDGSDVTLCGVFAEEVIYTNCPYVEIVKDGKKEKVVMIDLYDLATGDRVRTLTFSPKAKGGKVSLHIGNHLVNDLATVMRREPFEVFDEKIAGTHWAFLNQAVAMPGPGPLPKPLRIFPPAPGIGGGGMANVPCGPTHG